MADEVRYGGRFLKMVSRDGWEFVERVGVAGVVGIVAVTEDRKLLLVEQFRPPVERRVIELTAGLAGDLADAADEPLENAVQRELEEETGYRAGHVRFLGESPTSAGLTSETICMFEATGLERVSDGGGEGSESIIVHEIELSRLRMWLAEQVESGWMVDLKIHAGLAMAGIKY